MDNQDIMFIERKIDFCTVENKIEERALWNLTVPEVSDAGEERDHVCLSPDNFPPGTKITISVPSCPECGADCITCVCGFDWRAWSAKRYF